MERISKDMKHPKEITLFGISLTLEKLSYYGTRSLLMLYMTGTELNLSEKESINIYSLFAMSIMITPIIGAIIGDLKVGNRMALLGGLILQIIGTLLLIIPNEYSLYISLAFIALGSGFYIPNFNALLGKHYYNKLELLDGGFSVSYTLISLGSFIGPVLLNYLFPYNIKYALIFSSIILIIAFFFQMQVKNQSLDSSHIPNKENKTKWKIIGITLFGIAFYWTISNIIESYIGEMTTHGTNFYFEIVNTLTSIFISVSACFLWSIYYMRNFNKLKVSLIVVSFIVLIFLLIHYFVKPKSITIYYSPLLLMNVSEILIAPILYSLIIRNSNPKYLAILLSVAFIPIQLMQQTIGGAKNLFGLNDISIMMFMLIIALPLIILLHRFENKTKLCNACT